MQIGHLQLNLVILLDCLLKLLTNKTKELGQVKSNMEGPKQGAATFGQLSASLNNFFPNSGRNVILTDIGHLYEYYLKKGEKYLYPF
jgi:hypothetical protein